MKSWWARSKLPRASSTRPRLTHASVKRGLYSSARPIRASATTRSPSANACAPSRFNAIALGGSEAEGTHAQTNTPTQTAAALRRTRMSLHPTRVALGFRPSTVARIAEHPIGLPSMAVALEIRCAKSLPAAAREAKIGNAVARATPRIFRERRGHRRTRRVGGCRAARRRGLGASWRPAPIGWGSCARRSIDRGRPCRPPTRRNRATGRALRRGRTRRIPRAKRRARLDPGSRRRD